MSMKATVKLYAILRYYLWSCRFKIIQNFRSIRDCNCVQNWPSSPKLPFFTPRTGLPHRWNSLVFRLLFHNCPDFPCRTFRGRLSICWFGRGLFSVHAWPVSTACEAPVWLLSCCGRRIQLSLFSRNLSIPIDVSQNWAHLSKNSNSPSLWL